jgi:hypothetical protein
VQVSQSALNHGRLSPFDITTGDAQPMIFALSIGRIAFELTRSDVLLKFGDNRELYWSWAMSVGPVFQARDAAGGWS